MCIFFPGFQYMNASKLTLVLDLDHTLIYTLHPKDRLQDVDESLRTHKISTKDTLNPDAIFVIERPGLVTFLQEVRQFCEVMLFTASSRDYALPILRVIDPDQSIFVKKYFREHTSKYRHYPCVKDLALLDIPLNRVVMVDDEPGAYSIQQHNAILAPKFSGDPHDDFLLALLLPLIRKLAALEDVRDFLA